MNPFSAKPKETILQAAAAVAKRNGPSKFNIRAVASECGVSVGTIYNFYDSKETLLLAVVDSFWQDAFDRILTVAEDRDLTVALELIYKHMHECLLDFGESWMHEISGIQAQNVCGREIGRTKMDSYFLRLQQYIQSLLLSHFPELFWSASFSSQAFSEFILDNMLFLLRRGAEDCLFITALVTKLK